MDTLTPTDPIDELIPPPRPWWARLLVAVMTVSMVGLGSWLFGYGYVYPRPECCGSSSSGALMALTPDHTAVTVAVVFFNSSGRVLEIRSASANLPGAHVQRIDIALSDDGSYSTVDHAPLPAVVKARHLARIVITFVPTTCQDSAAPWGSLALELDVVNRWLPSVDRHYTLPQPVVGQQQNELSVFPPNDDPIFSTLHTPLAAACALLSSRT